MAGHDHHLRLALPDCRRAGRPVQRLSRAGHRPHRQRRVVAGAEKYPHGASHRQPDHHRHAAARHYFWHCRRLLQRQGRRRHPVPLHHHHVDPRRAAGGRLRADDAGVYRQPCRPVRHLGRAGGPAAVPALHDSWADRLGGPVPPAARRNLEAARAGIRAGGARVWCVALAHHDAAPAAQRGAPGADHRGAGILGPGAI
ncbi:hypothetical protein D3C87_1340070 [compost metagenome]